MSRLPPLDLTRLDPEQQRVADAIRSGPRGAVIGPLEVWLRSPGLADPAQRLGAFCRYHSALPSELSELAIILVGKHWQSAYEFAAHAPLAIAAGAGAAVVEAIRAGTPPPYTDARAAAIHALVTEYLSTHAVADTTYQRAVELLGERGVVDLVGIIGYYCLICVTLNVFEVPLPEGTIAPVL
ncbi:MAG: carboxymuconolactone decarboxylase family protein [Dehalococcoidia bacterium]|nr:carboxymuconolactone decarboxylase family protein [Dehalococcoidia bacterium]